MIEWIAVAIAAALAWLKLVHDPRQRRIGKAEAVLDELKEKANEAEAIEAELEALEDARGDRIDDVDSAVDFINDLLGAGSDPPG